MSVNKMSYIEFKNSVDTHNLMWTKDSGDRFDDEYLKKVVTVLEFLGDLSNVLIYESDNRIDLEYRKFDKYINLEIFDDDNINGYIALGAWDNTKQFDIESSLDQLRVCVSLLQDGAAQTLKTEWVTNRKG